MRKKKVNDNMYKKKYSWFKKKTQQHINMIKVNKNDKINFEEFKLHRQ